MGWLKKKRKEAEKHYWYFTLGKRTKDGEVMFAWWMAESDSRFPPVQKVGHEYCDRYGSRPYIICCLEISKEDYEERMKNILANQQK